MSQIPQSPTHIQTISLLGCGWLGIALAHALIERGCHVRGSTTQASRLGSLSSVGVEPFLLRIDGADSLDSTVGCGDFFSSDVLVIDVPPEISLGTEYHPAQVESILKTLGSKPVKQIVYVSSTSVYGADQGAVDETVVPIPDGDSGAVLLRVEQMLKAFALARSVGLTIVRPGGLVGPGRHPGLFLAGRKELKNGHAPVNMVQQLELADWMASLIVDHPPLAGACEVYNAVSPHHPTREEFYVRAAMAIGVQPPTFSQESSLSIAAGAGKLVLSDKIRSVTGVKPRFADLYAAIGASR